MTGTMPYAQLSPVNSGRAYLFPGIQFLHVVFQHIFMRALNREHSDMLQQLYVLQSTDACIGSVA